MIRMPQFLPIGIILSFAIAATANPQKNGDTAALQGKWKVAKIIKRGKLLAEDRIARMSVEFSKDKMMILSRGGQDKRDFAFKIDATKKPTQIDLTAESGSFNGKTIGGIYQLKGDTLLLCIPDDDNTIRPDAFDSLGGMAPSRSLFTLERVKD